LGLVVLAVVVGHGATFDRLFEGLVVIDHAIIHPGLPRRLRPFRVELVHHVQVPIDHHIYCLSGFAFRFNAWLGACPVETTAHSLVHGHFGWRLQLCLRTAKIYT